MTGAKKQPFQSRPIPKGWEAELDKYWYHNDPVKTHFYNALSTLFPLGEGHFIWSVKSLRHKVHDPGLLAQIESFVTQEVVHTKAHCRYNQKLSQRGYPIAKMDRAMAKRIDYGKKNSSLLFNLATTVAAEHFTAVIGDRLLRGIFMHDLDNSAMRDLWRWHAVEEVEHKSVAMEVFQQAGGSYWTRLGGMYFILWHFWLVTFFRMMIMLQIDGQLWRWRSLKSAVVLFLGFRRGIFPCILADTLRYFSPRFHPEQMVNEELIREWDQSQMAQAT